MKTDKQNFNDKNLLNKSPWYVIQRGRERLTLYGDECRLRSLEYAKTHRKEKVEYDKMYYLWRTSWGKGVNSYNVKCGYHSGRENNLLDISIDCLD